MGFSRLQPVQVLVSLSESFRGMVSSLGIEILWIANSGGGRTG